ncbi:MAG TPA: ABC transporter permease [Vicinamibacterales bacterium]|nr:ABC transporter permease [Vicinamibacterales bacterium]
MLTEFLRDLRFGARLLRRSPGFTFTALVSLALGIGGATAVFSLVNAIVLRPLPVPEPDQLYVAEVQRPGQDHGEILSSPTFLAVRDAMAQRGAGELFAATNPAGMQLQPAGDGNPVRGSVQLVSGEYFTVLRQLPQAGRLLSAADNLHPGGHPVAVISDGYWRRRLNAAPDAVGRQLAINGAAFTIVGVASPGFFGTTLALRAPDAWIPYAMQADVRYSQNASNSDDSDLLKPWTPQPNIEWLSVFVRVPSGTSVKLASDAFTTAYRQERDSRLAANASADDRSALQQRRVALSSASAGVSSLRRAAAQPLFVLLAMVGVLLLIACGNVAGLLLSRAAGRQREIAIRLSLGAGRSRVVRQLVAESLLLAVGAALLGITFAVWARDGLLALMVNVGTTPIDLDTGLDLRVLGFCLGVSAFTGIACGVLPAWRAASLPVAESLKQQTRSSVGAHSGRRGLLMGKVLVASQMAFCLLLLVVAGLFARSLRQLTQIDVGFDRDRLLTARLDVRGAGYSAPERLALYRRLTDMVNALPGVRGASLSLTGPIGGSQRISSLSVEGVTVGRGDRLRTNEEIVTTEYFETVGLRLIEGRLFGPQDAVAGGKNTIVNATMARRFFPGQSAVGKRWGYGEAIDKDAFVIIGVVEDARYAQVRPQPPNMVYHLVDATPDDVLSDLEVRTDGAPGALARTVRETLTAAEPRLPIVEVVPLDDRIARGVSQDRMVARLTSMFGALALLLASLGLYGTISYGISRRVSELGLRMALGADRGMVLWMVLREALALVLAGAAIGLPLAFLAGRSMRSLLFNVQALDPWSFGIGAVLLVAVAAVAAYLPAYRASRIEPMVALGR